MKQKAELRGPNRVVWDALRESRKAISAYDLLATLKQGGVNNPTTVYRALYKLVKLGLVHRIAALNGFIACHARNKHGVVGFTVCRSCKQVVEIDDPSLDEIIRRLGHEHHFHTEYEIVELVGVCRHCREEADPGQVSA